MKIPVCFGQGWYAVEYWKNIEKSVRWSGHIGDIFVEGKQESIVRLKFFNNKENKNLILSLKELNKNIFFEFKKETIKQNEFIFITIPLKNIDIIRITSDCSQGEKDKRLVGVCLVQVELLDKNQKLLKKIPIEYIASKKEKSVQIQSTQVKSNINFLRKNKEFDKHIGSICLVNHCSNPYGATHYLFSLFNFLKEKNYKVCILDEKENFELYEKYKIETSDVISYEKDSMFLSYLYHYLKPSLFYLNSINHCFTDFIKLNKKSNNILIHSHEIFKHYNAHEICPDFVVSNRIRDEFIKIKDCNTKVQPPFLNKEFITKMDEELTKEVPKVFNDQGQIDYSKITIGMCGQTEERKNPLLFLETASKFKDKNFLWIGGEKGDFPNLPNLYHVPCVKLPYSYYKLIDYFVLFSKEDPCPYVVLENLYANNKVITFKENIFTDHKCPLLEDLYLEFDGSISLKNVSYMIEKYAQTKRKTDTKNGSKYILENFTSIKKELMDCFKK